MPSNNGNGAKGSPCTGLTMENIHIQSVLGCKLEGAVRGRAVGTVEATYPYSAR